MHPVNDTKESLPPYNVFAEQEKAFFKRDSASAGGNYYDQPRSVTPTPGHQRPTSSSSSPTVIPASPQASLTASGARQGYTHVPPYRAAAPVQPNPNPTASNQFGVLVPGWGSTPDARASSSSAFDSQDVMQFVPVATKGSGAPGRGPTKRKKA